MTIQDVAALAEIIAAIAVIFSLIYLARQIRQTNIINRSAAHQAINAQMSENAIAVAANPSLAAVFSKVHYHGLKRENATEIERIQLAYLYSAIINAIHFMHQQMKAGILSESEVNEWVVGTAVLRVPYLHSLWPVLSGTYPEDFQRWFEARYHLDRPPADWKDPVMQPAREH